jgi:transglycosylase-like protein with SLT domain
MPLADRSRRLSLVVALGVLVVVLVVVVRGGPQRSAQLVPGAAPGESSFDPLAYTPNRQAEFERRAAAGLAHVLYVKSPGGVLATARRVARWRPQVDAAAEEARLDPGVLEAIVFLESAGRENARASDDLNGAAGLTQILAETGRNLLDMRIDVAASARLTRGILRGHRVIARRRLRRKIDERFDPAKALAGTARYLTFARGRLGRDDLAIVSYHMGVGNLQRALAAYGTPLVPYAQLFFESTPLRHPDAWAILGGLGDDSATYLWRVLAARDIMARWRRDPAALARLADLQDNKNSAEEVLHPLATTERFADPFAVDRALSTGELVALPTGLLRAHGFVVDRGMGDLAGVIGRPRRLYRALRGEALALLLYLGSGVQAIAPSGPLTLTSTARDLRYQRLLARRTPEATRGYSLHTTGWAFDIARRYSTGAQARAFQFMLDRLTALDLIAWVREAGAIHVTAGRRAAQLLPLLTETGSTATAG